MIRGRKSNCCLVVVILDGDVEVEEEEMMSRYVFPLLCWFGGWSGDD